jgi:hypothetical protein
VTIDGEIFGAPRPKAACCNKRVTGLSNNVKKANPAAIEAMAQEARNNGTGSM